MMIRFKLPFAKKYSFFYKLLFSSLSMVIILSTVIGAVSYVVSSRILVEQTENYRVNELKQIDENLHNLLEDVNHSTEAMEQNKELKQVFADDHKSSSQRYLDSVEVDKILERLLFNNENVLGCVVISKFQNFSSGKLLNGNYDYNEFINQPVYNAKIKNLKEGQIALLKPEDLMKGPIAPGYLGNWLIIARHIKSYSQNDVIVITFISPVFLTGDNSNGDIYASNNSGEVTWVKSGSLTEDPRFILTPRMVSGKLSGSISGGKKHLVYIKSSILDWYLVYSIPEFEPLYNIRYFVLKAVLTLIAFCIFASVIASRGLTIRIKHLKNALVHINITSIVEPRKKRTFQKSWFPFSVFNSMNYGFKLFFFYMCIVIVPTLLLSILLYVRTVHIVDMELVKSFDQSVNQAASNINMLMDHYERDSKYLITNEKIQQLFLERPPSSMDEYSKRQQIISNEVMSKDVYRAGITQIDIYRKDGTLFYSTSVASGSSGPISKDSEDYIAWSDPQLDGFNNLTFSLQREMKGNILFAAGYSQPIGYVKLYFGESFFSQMYKDQRTNDKVIVIVTNRQGGILSTNDKQLINTKMQNIPMLTLTKSPLIAKEELKYAGWTIYAIVPATELFNHKPDLITYNLFSILIMMLLIIIISINRSASFFKPVQELISVIKRVQKGQWGARFSTKSGDEIEHLGQSFNKMLERLQELVEDISSSKIREHALETKKKQAELNALQAQINPHFLYNTFESINWLIIANENEKATTMITALADLFRIGINRGQYLVGLEEELQHAEAYIVIQKIRYNEKLDVKWDIRLNPREYRTMKLILQPLIENAIYHGIELKEGHGLITISVWTYEAILYLQIKDDGLGMNESKLLQLRNNLSNWESDSSRSIGLRNVNERIKLLFGDQYGLQIESQVESGTLVTATIPLLAGSEA